MTRRPLALLGRVLDRADPALTVLGATITGLLATAAVAGLAPGLAVLAGLLTVGGTMLALPARPQPVPAGGSAHQPEASPDRLPGQSPDPSEGQLPGQARGQSATLPAELPAGLPVARAGHLPAGSVDEVPAGSPALPAPTGQGTRPQRAGPP